MHPEHCFPGPLVDLWCDTLNDLYRPDDWSILPALCFVHESVIFHRYGMYRITDFLGVIRGIEFHLDVQQVYTKCVTFANGEQNCPFCLVRHESIPAFRANHVPFRSKMIAVSWHSILCRTMSKSCCIHHEDNIALRQRWVQTHNFKSRSKFPQTAKSKSISKISIPIQNPLHGFEQTT